MFEKSFVKEMWQIYVNEFFLASFFPVSVWVLFLLARDLSLTEIGLLASVAYAINLVLEYPSGIFADKYGRKLSMQVSLVAFIAGLLTYAFSHSLLFFIIAAALVGVSFSFKSGSEEALIYDSLKSLKKEKQNKDVLGLLHAIGFSAIIIAALVGPIMYKINIALPYIAMAVAVFIGLLIFSTYKEPRYHKPGSVLDTKLAFKSGFKILFRNKTLLYVLLLAISLFFFEHAWTETHQFLLTNAGFPFALLGIYFAVKSAMGIIGGLTFPKIVSKLKVLHSISLVIVMQVLALFFISSGIFWLMAVFSYFLLLSHMLWMYVDADIIHKHIPSNIRATTLSARQMLVSLVFVFNPWLMTYLVQTFALPVFFYFAVIVLVLGSAIAFAGKEHLA